VYRRNEKAGAWPPLKGGEEESANVHLKGMSRGEEEKVRGTVKEDKRKNTPQNCEEFSSTGENYVSSANEWKPEESFKSKKTGHDSAVEPLPS